MSESNQNSEKNNPEQSVAAALAQMSDEELRTAGYEVKRLQHTSNELEMSQLTPIEAEGQVETMAVLIMGGTTVELQKSIETVNDNPVFSLTEEGYSAKVKSKINTQPLLLLPRRPTTVGRDDNGKTELKLINDPATSRAHMTLTTHDNTVSLEDHSSNGTRVITKRTSVQEAPEAAMVEHDLGVTPKLMNALGMTAGSMEVATPKWIRMDEAVDPESPQTLTANMNQFLRENLKSPGMGRYTEMHMVMGVPQVLIAPRAMRPYGATIEGTHSLIDELRAYDAPDFPNYMEAIDKLGGDMISTDSIIGKGKSILTDEGKMQLEIRVLRGGGRSSVAWLGELQKNAEKLGYDGGVVVNETWGNIKDYNLGDAELTLSGSMPEITTVDDIDEAFMNPDMISGIMTKLEIDEPTFQKNGSSIVKRAQVQSGFMQAATNLHRPLYERAQIEDQNGYIAVNVDDKIINIGVRYSIDKRNVIQKINIFYDQDYGTKVAQLERQLVTQLQYDVLSNPRDPISITVQKGKERGVQIDRYMIG